MENVTKTMEKKDNGNTRNSRAKLALILEKILVYAFLIFNVLICFFVFYILIVNSTMSKAELQGVFTGLPSTHFFENLESALFKPETVNILQRRHCRQFLNRDWQQFQHSGTPRQRLRNATL